MDQLHICCRGCRYCNHGSQEAHGLEVRPRWPADVIRPGPALSALSHQPEFPCVGVPEGSHFFLDVLIWKCMYSSMYIYIYITLYTTPKLVWVCTLVYNFSPYVCSKASNWESKWLKYQWFRLMAWQRTGYSQIDGNRHVSQQFPPSCE